MIRSYLCKNIPKNINDFPMFLFQARNEISVRLARRNAEPRRNNGGFKGGFEFKTRSFSSSCRGTNRTKRGGRGRRRGDAAVRRKEEGKETKREGRSHRGHSERQGIQEGTQQWVVGGRKMLESRRARDRRGRMRKVDVGGQGIAIPWNFARRWILLDV